MKNIVHNVLVLAVHRGQHLHSERNRTWRLQLGKYRVRSFCPQLQTVGKETFALTQEVHPGQANGIDQPPSVDNETKGVGPPAD